MDQSGTAPARILNADLLVRNATAPNTASNPAPRGSAITFFVAGAGAWTLPYADGAVVVNPFEPQSGRNVPVAPVSLAIGGQPARLLYVSSASGEVSGILQVNAVVPENIARARNRSC